MKTLFFGVVITLVCKGVPPTSPGDGVFYGKCEVLIEPAKKVQSAPAPDSVLAPVWEKGDDRVWY